ncbi:MAG: response regulator [bacterium]
MTKKAKVLTVDDDPFYGNLYRDILEARGYEVSHALNASDGLRLVREFRPDVVMLDVMMPEKEGLLDGYGLLEELRSDREYRDLPVIMVSALGEESDIRRARELGADDYLPKQALTPDGFVGLVETHLK